MILICWLVTAFFTGFGVLCTSVSLLVGVCFWVSFCVLVVVIFGFIASILF